MRIYFLAVRTWLACAPISAIAAVTAKFENEVPGEFIGTMVMDGLRDIDSVAYVRFASVYRRFQEATDFVQAVKKLEVKRDTATIRLPGF